MNQTQSNTVDKHDDEHFDEEREYNTEDLLDRAYRSFILDTGRIKLVKPMFEKKDRKSYIHNFSEVCKSIGRDQEEVKRFLSRELQMESSFKENGSLKIDAIVRSAGMIEKILQNYVIEFVMCKSCKSCKTTTTREDRITFLVCNACKAKVAIHKPT